MLFITAGMGGGTGTGAAPVVAQIARDLGILTVAVVTTPFTFEGGKRAANAERGIRELQKSVDSLICVSNDKLLDVVDESTSFEEAFNMADQVLKFGVAGISDLVAIPGLINLDLADVTRVMKDAGICHMGIGRASGEDRAQVAIKQAINSPLLDTNIEGATGVILNFTGGRGMRLSEIDAASSIVRNEASTRSMQAQATEQALPYCPERIPRSSHQEALPHHPELNTFRDSRHSSLHPSRHRHPFSVQLRASDSVMIP